MTPLEKYETIEELIKEFSSKMLNIAEELLIKESLNCKHKWQYFDSLFYFCGETYPGYKCELCGTEKRNKQ